MSPDEIRRCARGCTRARRHLPDCPQDECAGCLPREAEHGDLCWGCHRRLELMLVDFPTVVDWLRVHLPTGRAQGPKQDWQRRPGEDESTPTPLNVDVLDLGEQVAASLQGWVELLVERTSLSGPEGTGRVSVDAPYLRTHLTAVENQDFVGPMWDELAWLTSQAHALAPWRPEVRRLTGVPCPECGAATLVIYGGDVDTTCQSCRAMIPEDRYELWVRIVAEEVAAS